MSAEVIWEGVYASLEEAVASGAGFGSDRWIERIRTQLLDYRADSHYLSLPPRPSDLPILCAITESRSILDLGGSSGWCSEYLQRALEIKTIEKYVIIEIEKVFDYMNEMHFHDNNKQVSFVTSPAHEKMDILYSNSVLQYIGDDMLLVNSIDQSRPKYILLEDFLGGKFEDYYTLQKYYDCLIPVKFRNRRKFIGNLQSLGYTLKLSRPYTATIRGKIQEFYMGNFPQDMRVRYGETLLFERE